MKTIGLCMIVKNEANVILRCLRSVRPLVDYVLVEDTGSTDGTQNIIRAYLAEEGLAGEVFDEPWRDFGYNRTVALERLRERAEIDYALIMDADDIVVLENGFDAAAFKEALNLDAYEVKLTDGGVSYNRLLICSNRREFHYRGVLHEFIESPSGTLLGGCEGFHILSRREGSRSSDPAKYEKDARILEDALETESDAFLRSRYTFYLAQSYRDSGDREKALKYYLKRAELGYWEDEVYVSLFEAGKLMSALGRPADEVLATFDRAIALVPARAEALHGASLYCRQQGRHAEGMAYAKRGLSLTVPSGGLFVQKWIYEYGLRDEYAVNAYWAGSYVESLDASLTILASGATPPAIFQRIAANAKFAADKLPKHQPPNLGSLGAESLVEQHKLVPARALHSRVERTPRVLVAILAKQKAQALPLYLHCIGALDYPKASIVLYIRTNNNTDATEQILRDWVARVGHLYAAVEFDASDATERIEAYGEHEWNETRFKVLGDIRNVSLKRALDLNCDYYFVADVDNFVRPETLRELVTLNLPIVAPFLRSIIPEKFYSNYHAEVDMHGYFMLCDQYQWILTRQVRGIIEVPVVHCTYLVRADVIPQLTYQDSTNRHEYVIFSESARKADIQQYLDNRQIYGYITFGDGDLHIVDGIDNARRLIEVSAAVAKNSASR